jgi:Domain of unknown function (DUF4361)/Domain of unknown function (DUF1735)
MKKIILLPLAILSIFFVGCDQESPMDKDLYPQKVYIVGAAYTIVDRDLNIGNLQDTISISVAVSGSRPSSQDVTVTVGEQDSAVSIYCTKNLSALVTQYRKLADGIYSYPSKSVTIKAGQVYNTLPIYISTASFHCDSLYMLPLKLTSTSAYKLTETDTVALVRINMMNQYSGLYYMQGVIRNMSNPKDTLVYKMSRNLKATDNGRTVRMYHYKNEFVEGDATDYRPGYAFKITVNSDNTLSLATWENFQILDGGGIYYPDLKLYDLWYTFNDNGVVRKTVGYLYKARSTTEEQRIIDDWLEDHPR